MFDLHSVWPWFSPFLLREKHEYLYSRTLENDFSQKGFNVTRIKDLYYCPECAREDIRRCGEPYGHVMHHLDGLNVCPVHLTPLKIYPRNKETAVNKQFMYFDKEHMDLSASERIKNEKLERICALVLELLSGDYLKYSLEDTLFCLKKCLYYIGYFSLHSGFSAKAFCRDLREYYSDISDFVELKAVNSSVMYSAFSANRLKPLPGLLSIGYFVDSLETFFALKNDIKIPCKKKTDEKADEETVREELKCVNPVCPHSGEPVGEILSETGGYVYYRCPHCNQYVSFNKQNKYYKVLQKGELWGKALLKKLREGIPKCVISRELNVKQFNIKNYTSGKTSFTKIDDKIKSYRQNLAESRERIIREGISCFREENDNEIRFLKKYDPEWFETFMSGLEKEIRQREDLLNDEKDEEMLELLEESLEKLKRIFPCKKITKHGLLESAGIAPKDFGKYKKTDAFFKKECETQEDFFIRQAEQIADYLEKHDLELNRKNFLKYFVGHNNSLRKERVYERALEHIMNNRTDR